MKFAQTALLLLVLAIALPACAKEKQTMMATGNAAVTETAMPMNMTNMDSTMMQMQDARMMAQQGMMMK